MTLLTARGLLAAYDTGGIPATAVDGVDLSVAHGEVLGIAGESGCGKSTLAAVLSLTARPPLHVLAGEVEIAGSRLSFEPNRRPPRMWRGTEVSLLPQSAMNALSPTQRIGAFAVDVIRAHEPAVRKKDALARFADRLDALGLPRRVLGAFGHQLSGGMRQRVVTAVSTVLNPKLLIADEPTSALDVSSQRVLVAMLRELLDRGLVGGIIVITHDLPVLNTIADRIAIMYAGQLVEVGPTRRIVEAARHPYTGALLDSVLVPEPRIRTTRITGIRGAPPRLSEPPPGCRFHPRCSLAMDVCRTDAPPLVGDEREYAACWWARDHYDEPVGSQL